MNATPVMSCAQSEPAWRVDAMCARSSTSRVITVARDPYGTLVKLYTTPQIM